MVTCQGVSLVSYRSHSPSLLLLFHTSFHSLFHSFFHSHYHSLFSSPSLSHESPISHTNFLCLTLCHTLLLHHSDPSIAAVVESNLRAALEKSYILEHTVKLKVQIDSIANYIAEQTAFLASLKNSISKQSRLHNQLMAKLSQLDPSCISGEHMFECVASQVSHTSISNTVIL